MKRIITYVEIDLRVCSLTYGSSPCTASIPTTGDVKCHNTRSTCQDFPNFADDMITLRFVKPTAYLNDPNYINKDIFAIPCIETVDYSPAKISFGQDLGIRSSLTVNFFGHKFADFGDSYDKYAADRGFDTFELSDFWSKFRARHPFIEGREIRLIQGTSDQAFEDMEVRTFIVDSFNGPTLDRDWETA